MTSCHHGHFKFPNNLKQAQRILKKYHRDIRVMEIDFVNVGENFVSSHDYESETIRQGSLLIEWIRMVILKHKKILWIDLKSRTDFLALFGCNILFKLDCRLFFRVLETIRRELKTKIQTHIWISCQDLEVRTQLIRYNDNSLAKYRWHIATDLPFVNSYAAKLILPLSFYPKINEWVRTYFLEFDFEDTDPEPIVCIDRTFFSDTPSLLSFIKQSTIPRGSTLLLYTFPASQKRLTLEHYKIIMQYDYTMS